MTQVFFICSATRDDAECIVDDGRAEDNFETLMSVGGDIALTFDRALEVVDDHKAEMLKMAQEIEENDTLTADWLSVHSEQMVEYIWNREGREYGVVRLHKVEAK